MKQARDEGEIEAERATEAAKRHLDSLDDVRRTWARLHAGHAPHSDPLSYQYPAWPGDQTIRKLIIEPWSHEILTGRTAFSMGSVDGYADAQELVRSLRSVMGEMVPLTDDICIRPDYRPVPCEECPAWTVRLFIYAGDTCIGPLDGIRDWPDRCEFFSGAVVLTIMRQMPKPQGSKEILVYDDGSGPR